MEVSSVEQEKPMADSSSLPTSNFTLKTFGGTPAAPWAFVRNKANFHHYADQEIGVPGSEVRQTKPISATGWRPHALDPPRKPKLAGLGRLR